MNLDVCSPTFCADNPTFACTEDWCGSGRMSRMVPDEPFGMDLRKACFIHDMRWDAAACWQDYYNSAIEFRRNVYKLCKAQHHHVWAQILSELYYFGVTNEISREIFKCEMNAKGIVL